MRQSTAEPKGVLALQMRNGVAKVEDRIRAGALGPVRVGTQVTTAAEAAKWRYVDIGQSARPQNACVEWVAIAVGQFAGVVVEKAEVDAVIAKPEYVHRVGGGNPNPAFDIRPGAYRRSIHEGWIHEGMIFSYAGVVAE